MDRAGDKVKPLPSGIESTRLGVLWTTVPPDAQTLKGIVSEGQWVEGQRTALRYKHRRGVEQTFEMGRHRDGHFPCSSHLYEIAEGIMEIVETHQTLDTLLQQWQPELGHDYLAYRNHVYRVFNFSIALAHAENEEREKLAIAAAFHDVGIWLDNTFDYLQPSSQRAMTYLSQTGREEWAESVQQMIDQHHKIRRWRGAEEKLTECFREADWLDVCLFALPSRLKRAYMAEVLRIFPRQGFHRLLVSLTLGWARKHPFNPLPIFKW